MQLISAVTATGDRTDLPLGLKVTLTEGWKIYWRSPGDAGLPPELSLADENTNSLYKLEMEFSYPQPIFPAWAGYLWIWKRGYFSCLFART